MFRLVYYNTHKKRKDSLPFLMTKILQNYGVKYEKIIVKIYVG